MLAFSHLRIQIRLGWKKDSFQFLLDNIHFQKLAFSHEKANANIV